MAGNILITGVGINIRGDGMTATIIAFEASAMSGFQFGEAASITACYRCGLEDLSISRAGSTVPDGSYGLDVNLFNYFNERNVRVEKWGVNRRITGRADGISISYDAVMPFSASAKTADWVFEHAAGIKILGGESGENGSDLFDRIAFIIITGQCNDVGMHAHAFLPRGPTPNFPGMCFFSNYINTTGVFRFIDCNTENISQVFNSDATVPVVTELSVIGGRYAPATTIMNFHASTKLLNCVLSAVNFGNGITLAHVQHLRIADCYIGGNLILTGGDAYSRAEVSGNDIAGAMTVTGSWSKLLWGINAVEGAITDTATGGVIRQSRVPNLLSADGYAYLDAKTLIQWGTIAGNAAADAVVTFPIAFGALPYSVSATLVSNPGLSAVLTVGVYAVSASGFTVAPRYSTGASTGRAGEGSLWIAIGPA
jgi:hypothetical protein